MRFISNVISSKQTSLVSLVIGSSVFSPYFLKGFYHCSVWHVSTYCVASIFFFFNTKATNMYKYKCSLYSEEIYNILTTIYASDSLNRIAYKIQEDSFIYLCIRSTWHKDLHRKKKCFRCLLIGYIALKAHISFIRQKANLKKKNTQIQKLK